MLELPLHLVLTLFFVIKNSYHLINDSNSCDSANQLDCLKCDKSKYRILNEVKPSSCICEEGGMIIKITFGFYFCFIKNKFILK